MRRSPSIRLLAGFVFSTFLLMASFTVFPNARAATPTCNEVASGRKTVTAYADNATEAVARAEQANPGWKAISAKKASSDPKSRSWQVTMTKD